MTGTAPILARSDQLQLLLDGIAEISKHGRSIMLALLVLIAYVLLTAFSQDNAAALSAASTVGASSQIELPMVGAKIPRRLFFLTSPFVILLTYAYLQIYLDELRRRLDRVSDALETEELDLASLEDIAYPWLVSFGRFSGGWKGGVANLVAIWLTPIALAALWSRFVLSEQFVSIFPLVAMAVAAWLAARRQRLDTFPRYVLIGTGIAFALFTLLSIPGIRFGWLQNVWDFIRGLGASTEESEPTPWWFYPLLLLVPGIQSWFDTWMKSRNEPWSRRS